MAEYYNVTTNLGDAEIAAAITNNAKIQITHIAFGDGAGSVPAPSKTRTTLVREVHRQAVTKYERHPTNPNWIVIETIIPSDIGGFTIREMGVIGNGKLISHGSHAPFEKVADPSGVSEYHLKFTQNITDGNVVSITLDESLIFATQAWVEENYINRSEIIDNLTTSDPTKPVSAKQAKILQDRKLDKDENAKSASKLNNPVKINGVDFDGAENITVHDSTKFLADQWTGADANPPPWNSKSGAYSTVWDGSTAAIAHFYGGSGSSPAFQLMTTFGSTGIFYRSARDNDGFVTSFDRIVTESSGVALKATKLNIPRKVHGVDFDGSSDIRLSELDILAHCPIAYPSVTIPYGYIALMGQAINQASYPKLYAIYGSYLPDLRGVFIRGLDYGRVLDSQPSRSILSYQSDAIRNISGQIGGVITWGDQSGAFYYGTSPSVSVVDNGLNGMKPAHFDASRQVPTSSENRVKNIAFLYIVKAG